MGKKPWPWWAHSLGFAAAIGTLVLLCVFREGFGHNLLSAVVSFVAGTLDRWIILLACCIPVWVVMGVVSLFKWLRRRGMVFCPLCGERMHPLDRLERSVCRKCSPPLLLLGHSVSPEEDPPKS